MLPGFFLHKMASAVLRLDRCSRGLCSPPHPALQYPTVCKTGGRRFNLSAVIFAKNVRILFYSIDYYILVILRNK